MFIAYFLYYRGLINLREHKGIGGLIGGGDLLFICCMEFADLRQYKWNLTIHIETKIRDGRVGGKIVREDLFIYFFSSAKVRGRLETRS